MTLGAIQEFFQRERKKLIGEARVGEDSMTAQQEDRVLELFHDNNSLLRHGGKASIVEILNRLGDDKVVEELEVADWWQRHKRAHKRRRKTHHLLKKGKDVIHNQAWMRSFVEVGRPLARKICEVAG